MSFGPGAVIAGRYHADHLVGAGGMGEVWAGELLANALPKGGGAVPGQKVALKRLLPAASQHHEVVARFRREAVLLGCIQSSHVARVYDFVDDPTFGPVLVMEFIEGPSLAYILEDRKLEVEEAVDLAVDLALALCDLHDAKIVHRDLKPGNIIMRPEEDGTTHAVIVDFGIGRQLASADAPDEITGITKANIALGTVEYMAPEQILNSREVTPVTDIYAIGAILFRALAGRHAFGERRGEVLARAKLIEDPPTLDTERDDEVAREVTEIVGRCLKKRPQLRFQSARDLHATMKRLQDRIRIAELDLDSTTADGSRTRVVQSALDRRSPEPTDRVPVFQPVAPPAPPRRPPAPPEVRASMSEVRPIEAPRASQADLRVSLSGAQPVPPPMPSVGRGSMPSISEAHALSIPNPRASMPSISTASPISASAPSSGSAPAAVASERQPFASIPDMGRPFSDAAPRRGVSVAAAVVGALAAFAVGGGVGVVVAPKLTGDPPVASASASVASSPMPARVGTAPASASAAAASAGSATSPADSARSLAVASASGSTALHVDPPSVPVPHTAPSSPPATVAAPVVLPTANPGATPNPTPEGAPQPPPPQQPPAPAPPPPQQPRQSSPL